MRAWSGGCLGSPSRRASVAPAARGRAAGPAVRGMARAAAVRLESVLFYFLKHSFPDLT